MTLVSFGVGTANIYATGKSNLLDKMFKLNFCDYSGSEINKSKH